MLYDFPILFTCCLSSVETCYDSSGRFYVFGFIRRECRILYPAAAVASPAGVLELDPHSSSEADPSKSLLPPVLMAPMVLPFLCSDDSELDTELPARHIPTTPISPGPSIDIIPPVDAPPRVCQQRAILIRPGQDIPIGRLYRTHPGGPCRALTARKSVGPLPYHRLALRYTSHYLDRFTSGSSSDHSSSDHSSADHSPADHTSCHPTPDQSLSRHSSPSIPLGMRPRLWLQSPVSSTRFSSTIESSPSDSPATTSDRHSYSLSHSVGLSRKRCRSTATTVPSSIPASGALVHTRADLLPPRKRFKDSIPPKDSIKENIEVDVLADIEVDATIVEVATYMDVDVRVDAGISMEVGVGFDIEDEDEDETESSNRGTMDVGVDVVAGIDTPDEDIESGQRELEARSLIAGGERARLLDRVAALERSNMRLQGTLRMESARVDRFRRRMSFMAGELRKIRMFRYYNRMKFRRLETFAARRLGFRP
ncbi:hypothetical protein Tco_1266189 [Tanacetum coccineum]